MALPKVTHKKKLDVPVRSDKVRSLTAKQEKFAMIFACEDVTQTEAALRAGFSENSAASIASQMLKLNPRVNQRIAEIKQELGVKYEVTFEGHVRKLAEIRDAALSGSNFAAAVAAEKSRGQAAGLYIDRKEILHGRIDQMSKEEVLKEIQKLQEDFPALQAIMQGNLVIEGEVTQED